MKRLKSLGSGKSKAKAEGAAKAANDHRTSPWPTVAPSPEEHVAHVPRHSHTQATATAADSYVNFSDDEIRAMEESALEYAIQESQQVSGRYITFRLVALCAHLSMLAATDLISGQFSDMLWPALQPHTLFLAQ